MSRACLDKPTYKNVCLYLFAVKGEGVWGWGQTYLSQVAQVFTKRKVVDVRQDRVAFRIGPAGEKHNTFSACPLFVPSLSWQIDRWYRETAQKRRFPHQTQTVAAAPSQSVTRLCHRALRGSVSGAE